MAIRIKLEMTETYPDTDTANSVTKEFVDEDVMYLPDVLRILTEALRGFGYVIPNEKGLAVTEKGE
jgi:hypothetical protein